MKDDFARRTIIKLILQHLDEASNAAHVHRTEIFAERIVDDVPLKGTPASMDLERRELVLSLCNVELVVDHAVKQNLGGCCYGSGSQFLRHYRDSVM